MKTPKLQSWPYVSWLATRRPLPGSADRTIVGFGRPSRGTVCGSPGNTGSTDDAGFVAPALPMPRARWLQSSRPCALLKGVVANMNIFFTLISDV